MKHLLRLKFLSNRLSIILFSFGWVFLSAVIFIEEFLILDSEFQRFISLVLIAAAVVFGIAGVNVSYKSSYGDDV